MNANLLAGKIRPVRLADAEVWGELRCELWPDVEGLYEVPEARGRGITRRLLRASVDWARQQKCTAFASDRADRVIMDRRYTV